MRHAALAGKQYLRKAVVTMGPSTPQAPATPPPTSTTSGSTMAEMMARARPSVSVILSMVSLAQGSPAASALKTEIVSVSCSMWTGSWPVRSQASR